MVLASPNPSMESVGTVSAALSALLLALNFSAKSTCTSLCIAFRHTTLLASSASRLIQLALSRPTAALHRSIATSHLVVVGVVWSGDLRGRAGWGRAKALPKLYCEPKWNHSAKHVEAASDWRVDIDKRK